jgi:hypothetical protein
MMIKVRMNNGEVRMVTARYYSQLIEKGEAKDFDGKEEKTVIETKEEKEPRKRRTKNAT